MTYEYLCNSCLKSWDVVKRVADMDKPETCMKCGEPGTRQFTPKRLYLNGTKVTNAEYNPALGQVVKNKKHKEELCKRMNVTEIGNDFNSGERHQKHFDKVREEKRTERHEKAIKDAFEGDR